MLNILKCAVKVLVTVTGAIIGIALVRPFSDDIAKAVVGEKEKSESEDY